MVWRTEVSVVDSTTTRYWSWAILDGLDSYDIVLSGWNDEDPTEVVSHIVLLHNANADLERKLGIGVTVEGD